MGMPICYWTVTPLKRFPYAPRKLRRPYGGLSGESGRGMQPDRILNQTFFWHCVRSRAAKMNSSSACTISIQREQACPSYTDCGPYWRVASATRTTLGIRPDSRVVSIPAGTVCPASSPYPTEEMGLQRQLRGLRSAVNAMPGTRSTSTMPMTILMSG